MQEDQTINMMTESGSLCVSICCKGEVNYQPFGLVMFLHFRIKEKHWGHMKKDGSEKKVSVFRDSNKNSEFQLFF